MVERRHCPGRTVFRESEPIVSGTFSFAVNVVGVRLDPGAMAGIGIAWAGVSTRYPVAVGPIGDVPMQT
jgi:hypothetical protein